MTQGHYAFSAETMSAAARLRSGDRYLVALPLFHANAQYYCVAAAIASAATICLVPRFSATAYLKQAALLRATHVSLFAAPIRMLLARAERPDTKLAIANAWYAQRLTEEEFEGITKMLGCAPREIYGMTELMGAVINGSPNGCWTEAIGYPTAGCRLGLRPDPDLDGGSSTEMRGELAVDGRRGVELCDGYLDDIATTEASWEDGWFRTGDLAEVAPDGMIRFLGRRGDTLKVAGENVSVLEVEAVVESHPAVRECAVIGEPDPVRDEVPVAFVVLNDDETAAEEELLAHCAQRLAPAKRPRRIEFIDELPRTSVGKIRRHALEVSSAERA